MDACLSNVCWVLEWLVIYVIYLHDLLYAHASELR
jgi:hypothetical protein